MLRKVLCLALLMAGQVGLAQASDYFEAEYGERLTASTDKVGLWWASSGWKIGMDKPLPEARGEAIMIRAARNEAEAAQLVVRPTAALRGLAVSAGALRGPGGATIPAKNVEVLRV
ncbi:MAG: hypothetical protein ABIF19_00440, partial [Planctomycetota bacterium]